jgi:glycosyltransferase involved in cell wall biosynthesis
VIVADGCAGREEIKDGVSGLWFKGADAEDLALRLNEIRDDTLVSRLSAAAYANFWSDAPTLARHVERISAVYYSMLARRLACGRDAALQQAAE